MKYPQDIVIAPIITEKSMSAVADRKYTFKVARGAGKIEIAKAVESLFNVSVQKVNTMNMQGRHRRQGAHEGYTSRWKKAIVTLTPSSRGIEFFESMT
ncbi:MAG: 50S ribosomal protein L23 [Oscillospiraceae bacterium]|nr:50S ribosomal protein L23 [Oscillospiraceae bacterium]